MKFDTQTDLQAEIGKQPDTAVLTSPPPAGTEPAKASVPDRHSRNYGIELLRILAMFFIVLLHVIGQGGVAGAAAAGSAQYRAAWILLAFAYPAVNCYALISGFVGCRSRFKPARTVSLWLSVVSINIFLWLVFRIFRPEIAAQFPLSACFLPLLKNQYWYFTAYFALSFLTPALNAAACHLPKKQFAFMLGALFVLFSLFPTAAQADLFYTHAGYSLLWLAVLYLAGAFMRLHFQPKKRRLWMAAGAVGYLVLSLALAFHKFYKEGVMAAAGIENGVYLTHYSYTSFFVIFSAVALVILFSGFNIGNRFVSALIGFFSKATFGVYILHTNALIWSFVLLGRFAPFAALSAPLTALCSLGAAAVIFLVCTCIEKLRALLFRLLHIDALLAKIPWHVFTD